MAGRLPYVVALDRAPAIVDTLDVVRPRRTIGIRLPRRQSHPASGRRRPALWSLVRALFLVRGGSRDGVVARASAECRERRVSLRESGTDRGDRRAHGVVNRSSESLVSRWCLCRGRRARERVGHRRVWPRALGLRLTDRVANRRCHGSGDARGDARNGLDSRTVGVAVVQHDRDVAGVPSGGARSVERVDGVPGRSDRRLRLRAMVYGMASLLPRCCGGNARAGVGESSCSAVGVSRYRVGGRGIAAAPGHCHAWQCVQ